MEFLSLNEQSKIDNRLHEFLEKINEDNVDNWELFVNQLYSKFWNPNTKWLCWSIPWKIIQTLHFKKNKIHILNKEMGLLSIVSADNQIATTFSLIKENTEWVLDWQNSTIWKELTNSWFTEDTSDIQLRFFDKPEDHVLLNLLDTIKNNNKWISQKFVQNQLNDIIYVFGYDEYERALANINITNESGLGGNCRGKLILFAGNPSLVKADDHYFDIAYKKSVILHEMIHEYTLYDQYWNGCQTKISCSNNLLSEGIATYFQLEYLLDTNQRKHSNIFKSKSCKKLMSGIECALKYRGKMLDLLDDIKFREFDNSKEVSGSPAYLIGASLIDLIINLKGIEGLRVFWRDTCLKDNLRKNICHISDEETFDKNKRKYLIKLVL